MKREIAMIAFVLLGMGMTASAQFGKKIRREILTQDKI